MKKTFFLTSFFLLMFGLPVLAQEEAALTNPEEATGGLGQAGAEAVEGVVSPPKGRLTVKDPTLAGVLGKIGDGCEQFNDKCQDKHHGHENFDYAQTLEQIIQLSVPTEAALHQRQFICGCLAQKVQPQKAELDQMRSQVKADMKNQVKKKLLNDFSSHLEDVHYFYYSSKNFRKNLLDNKSDFSVGNEFLCTSEGIYKKAFKKNKKCRDLKLSEADEEKRIAEIFGAFGFKVSDDLKSTLTGLKDDVLMSDIQNYNCSTGVYSRYCHDLNRSNISKSPSGKNADRFITNILKSSAHFKAIKQYSENHDISPLAAMAIVLTKDLKENSKDLIKLVDRHMLGDDLYQKFVSGINAGNLSENDQKIVFEKINHVVSVGVETNPGLDRVLKDSGLFKTAAKEMKGSSVMTYLENDKELMDQHFRENCRELASNIAETVCSDDDELLTNIGDKDFFEYIQFLGAKDERSQMLTGIIACENKGTSAAHLKDFVLDHNLRKTSDYFDLKNNQGKLVNLYSKLNEERKKPDSPVNRALNNYNNEYGSSFFGGEELAKDNFFGTNQSARYAKMLSEKPGESQEKNTESRSVAQSFLSKDSETGPDTLQNDSSFYSNSLNNSTTVQSNTSNASVPTDSKFDPRKELKDFLSGREDQQLVEDLMSNTSDDMMKQLLELKEEMDKNQKKILELTAENERLKLESMRRKMDNLQREREALDPGEPRSRAENSGGRRESPLKNTSNIGRNIASVAPVETGGSNSGSVSSAATSGSSDGASLSGLNRALLSSSSNTGRGPASDSSSNPVVVSASTARSGSIEVRSQEVGLDLLNYLSNNASDIQTLINLKTSGIIYKYKVLENGLLVEKEVLIDYRNLNEDVKKIIDKKIAQNKDRAREIVRLDNEIKELQRVYSYSALQLILADQIRK